MTTLTLQPDHTVINKYTTESWMYKLSLIAKFVIRDGANNIVEEVKNPKRWDFIWLIKQERREVMISIVYFQNQKHRYFLT